MKKTNFEWPEFNRDRDRISAYSSKFQNKSIVEAFAEVYGLNLKNVNADAPENIPPMELAIGDFVRARIINISKNRVDFDSSRTKSLLISNSNLYKYEKFKHFIPTDELKLKVVNKVRDRVTVDILAPMIEDFIYPRVKDPWIQKDVRGAQPILVKNLQLTRGGFIGKAVLPNVSEFVGEDYEVDAFIPGSQIVLNIAQDFEAFVGQDVEAFVINYMPRGDKMSLVCSVKEYLKYLGEMNMIKFFKDWTEDNDAWKEIKWVWTFDGYVTGTTSAAKKFDANKRSGVFIEIPELYITGMVNMDESELKNYQAGDKVRVRFDDFEEITKYNPITQQLQHIEPYIIEDNKIKKCNIKPILKLV